MIVAVGTHGVTSPAVARGSFVDRATRPFCRPLLNVESTKARLGDEGDQWRGHPASISIVADRSSVVWGGSELRSWERVTVVGGPRLDFGRTTGMSVDDNSDNALREARASDPAGADSAAQAPRPPAPKWTPSRSPTWRLHAAGPPASTQPRERYGAHQAASRSPFQANVLLRVAQLLAVVQAALGVATGINLLRGAVALKDVSAGVNLAGASHTTVSNYAVATLVIGGLLIVAGILTGRPSMIARVVVWLWAFVAFCVSLAAFYHGGSVLGFVTVAVFAASGGAILPATAVLAVDAVIFYALTLHPPTYSAFRERGRPMLLTAPAQPLRTAPPRSAMAASAVPPASASTLPAPRPAATEFAAAPPSVPPEKPHQQQASAAEQATAPPTSPRRRMKLSRGPSLSRLGAPLPNQADERSTRVSAPAAEARDYWPPSRAAKEEPADADEPTSHDGEPSE